MKKGGKEILNLVFGNEHQPTCSTILYILSNVDVYDEIAAARNRNGLLLEESVA